MGYKQHNSPFNSYRNPKRSVTNYDIKDLRPMPDFVTPPRETADGTTDLDSDDKSKESDNTQDFINNANANKSQGRLVGLQDRIDDPNTTPSQRLRLENRKDKVGDRYKRQEEIGELANKRKSAVRDTREARKTKRGLERQERIFDRQRNKGLIKDNQMMEIKKDYKNPKDLISNPSTSWKSSTGGITNPYKDNSSKIGDEVSSPRDYSDLEINTDAGSVVDLQRMHALEDDGYISEDNQFLGTPMKKQNNMKQINRRGSAFPMLQQDAPTDPNAVNPNRAGGALENGVLTNDPTNPQPIDKISAQTNDNQTRFADLASSAGITNPPPVDPNTSMNPMAPGATNTVGDGVGDPFGGAPAKKETIDFDGKKVSYDKGGMRENLTSQNVIKSGGKITPQIMKEAKEGDFGSKAKKQANFAENRFGFKGTK